MKRITVKFVREAAVLVAVSFLAGCQPPAASTGPAKAAPANPDAAAVEAWLTVTADPAEVDAARKAAAAAVAERYETIFQGLGAPQFIDDETMALLERKRADSVGRLTDTLEKNKITDQALGATLLLCRLQEVAGRSYAARILRDGTPAQRLRVLHGIDGGIYDDAQRRRYCEFLFAEPEFVAGALAQLDDRDEKIVKAAIQCCGYLGVPGANERFLQLLRKPDPPDPSRILFWLSKGEVTEEVFDYAVAASKSAKLDDFWGSSVFEAAAASKSEPMRRKAKAQLRTLLAASQDDGTAYTGNRLGIVSVLAKAADKTDGDWLLPLADSERGIYAVDLLSAYVRLLPDEGRRRLIERFDDDRRREVAVQAAGWGYKGTADAELIRELTKRIDTVDDRELPNVCQALLAIGGTSVRETIERVANRLDPDSLAFYRWKLNPTTYETIATAARTSGVLSAAEIDAALRELATTNDGSDDGDAFKDEPATADLFGFFEAAGSAVHFDVETDEIPCRHDELVGEFAGGSRGRFQPEAVLEIWRQKNPDDFEAPYTLQFVVKDRLYRADLRNLGDWYDAERVVQMINAALAREGTDERFTALRSGDQTASLVFADPKRLAPLAEKFQMRLSDDVEEAMRKGQEAEERVIRQLEERGK